MIYLLYEIDNIISEEVLHMTQVNMVLNPELNGVELYFDGKPVKQIITDLKANGFRYSGFKVCWYAKQNAKTLKFAQELTGINNDTEQQTPSAEEVVNNIPIDAVTKQQNKNKVITNLSLWNSTRIEKLEVNGKQPVKAIAAEVRKYVKARFPHCKFSVTSDHSSISFYIVSSPYEKDSIYLKAIEQYCTYLLQSYNYTTYGNNNNFYGAYANISYDYIQTEQNEIIKADIVNFDANLAEFERQEEERKQEEYRLWELKREQDILDDQEYAKKEAEQVKVIYNSIDIVELAEDKQYYVINSQMANCNKNNTLKQYQEEVTKGVFYLKDIKITKEIHFQNEESLIFFSDMLLNDFDFLEGTGGSFTEDVRFTSIKDYQNMTDEERESVIFNLYGVAVYYNNNLQFVVDAQGHSYARYVGLVDGVKIQKDVTVKQFVDSAKIEELKQSAETLIDFSAEDITCDNNISETWDKEDFAEYKKRMKQIFNKNHFKLTKEIVQQIPESHEKLKVAMYKLLTEVDGIQEQFLTADIKQGQKITLIYMSEFGSMITSRITFDSIEYIKYAQYDKAVKLIFKPEGKRKLHYSHFHSDILVYDGWLSLPKTVLNTVEDKSDVTITRSKYLSCDKRQYDEILNHFSIAGLKPIVNTYKPTF